MTTEISGRIGRGGPIVDIQFAVSHLRAGELRKAGIPVPEPVIVAGLLDTAAQGSSLDKRVIDRLELGFARSINLVTNTTEVGGEPRDQFKALATLGAGQDDPLTKTILVIEADFSQRGFLALVGRDLLQYCVFTYDGPGEQFTLNF